MRFVRQDRVAETAANPMMTSEPTAPETAAYHRLLEQQIALAQEKKGPGDLAKVIRSRGTWTVE